MITFASAMNIGLMVIGLTIAAMNPTGFQKANTLMQWDEMPTRPKDYSRDVMSALRDVPYRDLIEVSAVLPSDLVRATLREGGGNCANRTQAFAYELDHQGVDYQIIDVIQPESVSRGVGHTMIRLSTGLLDVHNAGLPLGGGKALDLPDLQEGPIQDYRAISLNSRKTGTSRYFGDFLEGAVIGYRDPGDMRRYWTFIEAIFIPIGNDRLEKMIYDGLALIVGVLPPIRVDDYQSIWEANAGAIILGKSALACIRAAILVITVQAIIILVQRIACRASRPI